MILLKLIETVLGILAVLLILTQMLLPLLTGRKLFPMFRKSRTVLEDEVRELQEQLSEKELVAHRDELRAKLNGTPPTQQP